MMVWCLFHIVICIHIPLYLSVSARVCVGKYVLIVSISNLIENESKQVADNRKNK